MRAQWVERLSPIALLLLLCSVPAEAHLNAVCTSTSESEPGKATVYLTTYHSETTSSGSLYVYRSASDSDPLVVPFDDACSPTVDYPNSIQDGIKNALDCSVPSNAAVKCYARPEATGGVQTGDGTSLVSAYNTLETTDPRHPWPGDGNASPAYEYSYDQVISWRRELPPLRSCTTASWSEISTSWS